MEADRRKAKHPREIVICLMETLHPSPPAAAPPTFTANIKVLSDFICETLLFSTVGREFNYIMEKDHFFDFSGAFF